MGAFSAVVRRRWFAIAVVQHSVEWNSKLAYGIRALLEEGTEIVAMLMLIGITRANSLALLASSAPETFAAIARFRAPLIVVAAVLVPVLTAATFVLPYPGGPANWLASSLYLACALLVVRRFAMDRQPFTFKSGLLLLYYLAASASASALASALAWA